MSAPRFAPLLLSALCLSACASGPPGQPVSRYPGADADTGGGAPLASLPAAAGRVVALRPTRYANGTGQEIVLDGPRAMRGENSITVKALTSARTGGEGQVGEDLKIGPPSDTDVASEMDRVLPGVPMRLAADPVRGVEGPIGYAIGRVGALSCVYAWQYLAPARPVSLIEGLADTGALPVSLRVRLCREQPTGALLDLLRGLRLSRPESSPAPLAARAAPGGDALTAAVGALPLAASRYADAADDAPAEAARPRRHGRQRLAAARPARHRRVAHVVRVGHRVAVRRHREEVPEFAAGPRVPMPGDVTAAAVPSQAYAPAPARPAVADQLPMPMPR